MSAVGRGTDQVTAVATKEDRVGDTALNAFPHPVLPHALPVPLARPPCTSWLLPWGRAAFTAGLARLARMMRTRRRGPAAQRSPSIAPPCVPSPAVRCGVQWDRVQHSFRVKHHPKVLEYLDDMGVAGRMGLTGHATIHRAVLYLYFTTMAVPRYEDAFDMSVEPVGIQMSQAQTSGMEAMLIRGADGLIAGAACGIGVGGQWIDQGMEDITQEGNSWRPGGECGRKDDTEAEHSIGIGAWGGGSGQCVGRRAAFFIMITRLSLRRVRPSTGAACPGPGSRKRLWDKHVSARSWGHVSIITDSHGHGRLGGTAGGPSYKSMPSFSRTKAAEGTGMAVDHRPGACSEVRCGSGRRNLGFLRRTITRRKRHG